MPGAAGHAALLRWPRAAAKEHLGEDADSGALFVFVNKRRNRLKVLWFDGNGHCLLYKRLHRARFLVPATQTIDARMLGQIVRGVKNERSHAR